MPARSPEPSAREFRRELGLTASTMLVIGSMVGSGIFIVSADIARTVGSPGLLLLVWIITGVVTLIAALSYGELAGMMPRAGGQYVYLREAYNPFVGFLYGWTLFMVIQSGTIAAVAVAFAKFTAVFFPGLGEKVVVLTLWGRGITAAQLVAVASVLVLTWINMRGVHEGKLVQVVFTVAKVAALFVLIVLGLTVAVNADALASNLSGFWDGVQVTVGADGLTHVPLSGAAVIAAMGVAMVGSLFSSDAWNNITFTAGEVINPKRTIPQSLAMGTAVVTLLYLLANVAYLALLPLAGSPDAADAAGRGIQFALSDRVGTAAASIIFGAPAEYLMAALIMVSTFGCNNGLILAGARVSYAMARDGLFFRGASRLNDRGVPSSALLVQAVWTSLLCLSGSYGELLDYVVFAVLLFYMLTIGGIFILRRTRPDAERPYRAFGYPVLPILYIVIAGAISIDLLVYKPDYTWPGLLIVLLGVPVYFLWTRFNRPAPENH